MRVVGKELTIVLHKMHERARMVENWVQKLERDGTCCCGSVALLCDVKARECGCEGAFFALIFSIQALAKTEK